MSTIEIIVIAILAIAGFWGYHKGVIKMVFRLISGLLSTIIAIVATPFFVKMITTATPIHEKLMTYIDKSFNWAEIFKGANPESIDPSTVLPTMGMPKLIQEFVYKQMIKSADTLMSTETFRNTVNGTLANVLIYVGGFLFMVIIAGIIVRILAAALEATSKLPVINSMNHVGGLAIGLLLGLLVIWIGLAVIQLGIGNGSYTKWIEQIQGSFIVKPLYDNNMVLKYVLGSIPRL